MTTVLRRAEPFSSATWFFSSTLGVVASIVVFLFVGLFVAFEPSPYREGIVRLFPQERRPRVREVLGDLAHVLRRWMVGRLFSMAVIGVLTWVGLLVVGLPLTLTLALLAGLLTFVPYVGPVLALVPAALLGLLQGPMTALWVIVLYTGIQIVESYLLTPLVQRKAVKLPPAVILLAQAILGVLAGVLGVMVATPLAAAALVLVKKTYVEGVLGDKEPEEQGG